MRWPRKYMIFDSDGNESFLVDIPSKPKKEAAKELSEAQQKRKMK